MKRVFAVLTENLARLVQWRLLRLRRGDIAAGFLPLLLFPGRRRSVFEFLRHRRPRRDLRALAASSLFPLISGCLPFALSLIGLTLASFFLGGLFNPGCGGVLTVRGSSAAFLDVFPRPPRRLLLLRFGRDEQRG